MYSSNGINWTTSGSGNTIFNYGSNPGNVGVANRRVLPYMGTTPVNGQYTPKVPAHWTNPAPTTIGAAIDRIAAFLIGEYPSDTI